jgi:hypothetical protein
MKKLINKVVEVNDHNFNLFAYLILALIIIDVLTNNFLSSVGINKTALLTFLGISAIIKIYFKTKNKVIIDGDVIQNISLRKTTLTLLSIAKKIIGSKKRSVVIAIVVIGAIFLYQKPTQKIINIFSQSGIANYVIYGILITLYILIVYINFYEKDSQENNPSIK